MTPQRSIMMGKARSAPRAALLGIGLAVATAGCGGKALVKTTCGPGSDSRVAYTHDGRVDFAVAGEQIVANLQDFIVEVPLAGGDGTKLVQALTTGELAVAQGSAFYVGEHGQLKAQIQALFSVPLAGGQPQLVIDNVSGSPISSDGDSVYLQTDQTHVLEVDAKSSATVTLQLDSQLGYTALVTAYGGFVYVVGQDPTAGNADVIERIPKQGGAAQRIYSASGASVGSLTADASGLYWNEIEAGTYGSGSIRHANLDGSSPETLLPHTRAISLDADGGALYFSEGDRIARLTPDGHDTTLVQGLQHPSALQLSAHDAVWLEQLKTDPNVWMIEVACVR